MKKIPKLRFPEFSGEWEEKKLENLCSFRQGYQIPFDEQSKEVKQGYERYLYISDFFSDRNILYVKKTDRMNKFKENEIAIANTGNSAGTFYRGKAGILSNNMFSVKIDLEELLSSDFLYKFLGSNYYESQLKTFFNSSGQPHLGHKNMGMIILKFPSLPEQEEIASFLSSVDSKIEKLERKKELWEQYKKGMMQKIFSQELRFRDENGEDYPEWEEKLFGDLYSFKTTNSYSRDNLNYEFGEVKNIHYGDIHTKFRTLFDIDGENVPFINQDISLEKISDENYCQNGDIVIADASEDYADIGKSIEIINTDNKKILAGLHTLLARPLSGKVALGFGGYLMKSSKMHSQIKVIAQGTKVLSISTKRVADLKFPLPSLPEQIQIADFLSSLDSKIEIVEKELAGMKEFKKGLLQKMFV